MKKIVQAVTGVRDFFGEVKVELTKCAWPTRQELHESTVVVIISVILLGTFVGVSDLFFVWLLRIIVG